MTNVIPFRSPPPPDEPEPDGRWRPLQGAYNPPPANTRSIGTVILNTLLVIIFLGIIWPVVFLTLVALAI